MQSRRDKSCWQLFLGMLPGSNLHLLKTLCVGYLLLDQRVAADEAGKYKFFNTVNTGARDPLLTLENPCVQSAPGRHLAVMGTSIKGKYTMFECNGAIRKGDVDCDKLDLNTQIRRNTFIGDSFCDGKLQTLKDSRMEVFKEKTFSNTNYEIDLSDPTFVGVEIKNSQNKKL